MLGCKATDIHGKQNSPETERKTELKDGIWEENKKIETNHHTTILTQFEKKCESRQKRKTVNILQDTKTN